MGLFRAAVKDCCPNREPRHFHASATLSINSLIIHAWSVRLLAIAGRFALERLNHAAAAMTTPAMTGSSYQRRAASEPQNQAMTIAASTQGSVAKQLRGAAACETGEFVAGRHAVTVSIFFREDARAGQRT